MHTILIDCNESVVDALKAAFQGTDRLEVWHGNILDIRCDAVVSPANSFGFMDGGIDLAYAKHFGWELPERLQARIKRYHHGELLVGMAEIVPTGNETIPYLIAAPTMRVPANIQETSNVYLAMRAVFLLLQHGKLENGKKVSDAVKSVAIPGMGTGVGGVRPKVCAVQMKQAWDDIVGTTYEFPSTCYEAWKRHERMVVGLTKRDV